MIEIIKIFISKLIIVFKYKGELEEILKDIRKKQEAKDREDDLNRLKLCFKHRQEKNHSRFSEHNCDYCNLLKKNEELKKDINDLLLNKKEREENKRRNHIGESEKNI